METTELIDLLSRGEDSRHQFKENFSNADALAAEIVAFSNTAGGKIFIARRVQLDTGHARQSLFHLSIELVCPRGDSRRADVLVKTNCLR